MIEHTPQTTTKNDPPRGYGTLAARLLVLVLGLAVTAVILSIVLTRFPILGYRTVILAGGSMEPALHSGSLIVSRQVEPRSLAAGDVITFRHRGSKTTITHRITNVREENGQLWFTTKGDANATADSNEVGFANGVTPYMHVLAVPYVGYLLSFINSRTGIALLVLVPLLGLGGLHLLGSEPEEQLGPEASPPR